MIKEYKEPNRLKLPSLFDIMEGRATVHYTVHREHVIWAALKTVTTKEEFAKVIKVSYDYFYGKHKNFLTLDQFSEWLIEVHGDPLKGTTTF